MESVLNSCFQKLLAVSLPVKIENIRDEAGMETIDDFVNIFNREQISLEVFKVIDKTHPENNDFLLYNASRNVEKKPFCRSFQFL